MKIEIRQVFATQLFPRQKGDVLKQRAWMDVLNYGTDRLIKITHHFDGEKGDSFEQLIPKGETRVELLLMDIASPRALSVTCEATGQIVATWKGVWKPARKWKVYQVKSSHYDLGYDGRIDAMQRDAANYLEQAERLCTDKDQHHSWHYHIEHLRFLRAYGREKGELALKGFVQRNILGESMTLSGNIGGPHFHWMDTEQLIRSTYPARRELKDRFDLDVNSISVVDNPSASWSSFQIFAEAGFRTLFRFAQGFRSPGDSFENGLPPIAWMVGPNGRGRILTSFHNSYGEPLFLGFAGIYGATHIKEAAEILSDHLAKVERGEVRGDYPYDTLIVSNYLDFEPPHEEERVLRRWKEEYVYPEVHLENAPAALESIGERYADVIPVLQGDTNNNSGDYTSIDPEVQGIKRKVLQCLYRAEAWHVLARLAYPSRWAGITQSFRDIYMSLAEFDEHCWPTMLSVNEQNIFNTVLTKRHAIGRSLHDIRKICGDLSKQLSEPDKEGDESHLVWNSLAHPRKDVVVLPDFPIQNNLKLCMHDSGSDSKVPIQQLADGSCVFVPSVPAYGFSAHRLEAMEARTESTSVLSISQSGDQIILMNRWIRVKAECSTGAVLSIVHRERNVELLDPSCEWGFNEFIRCHAQPFSYSEVSSDLELTRIGVSKATVFEEGPVRASLMIHTIDKVLDAEISTRLTLYADLDYLEVENTVQRMGFLHTQAKERYQENVFIAFPFAIKTPSFAVDYAVGVIDPSRDFIPSSNTDFVVANRWIDVSNECGGVTVAPVEAQTFHCGALKYNEFGQSWERDEGHLYSYAWSNRMSGLSHQQAKEYKTTLTYRIRPYSNHFNASNAASFGWRMGSPPVAFPGQLTPGTAKNLLSLNASNVQVAAMKVSEAPGRGTVLRLIETGGLPATDARLSICGIPCDRVTLCDLVENDLEPVAVENGMLSLKFGPYSVVTIRLEAAPVAFDAPSAPTTEVINDSSVLLKLKGKKGSHIFRSEVSDEPATAHSLVGYASGDSFLDADLKPGTCYTYRVADATPLNQQGPVGPPVTTLTRSPATTPPAMLKEVGVVPMASGCRWVYWAKAPEPDTAFYRLYRGKSPDFSAEAGSLLHEVAPQPLWYQTYEDHEIPPPGGFFYRVQPVDFCGNEQANSICFGRFTLENGGIYE